MIKQVKKSKFKKTIAIYLAMMILLEAVQPMQMFALTGGPKQPEFESFTPIGTSDMVDLASGDFNYNIPIMDVGGYPINLAYNSVATMDQEASWVGLGWDLNVGQISRQLRGLPDDFNGDEMIYENNLKPNVTIGAKANVFLSPFGVKETKASVGVGINYNNYDGFSMTPSAGLNFQVLNSMRVGVDVQSSASEGVSITPSISYSKRCMYIAKSDYDAGLNAGVTYNSRKGVESATMSFSAKKSTYNPKLEREVDTKVGLSGGVSFIDASFTPTKRVGMVSDNYMFSMNLEAGVWGIDPGLKFSGFRSSQGIKDSEKYKVEKGYGFENTYNAERSAILDFNREKDRTFNKNTTSLPVTNNTYDLYSIQGQGVSGMFRPYKSQVGYVYDNETIDATRGGSLGLEFGPGASIHFGLDATVTFGKSKSSVWDNSNAALGRLVEKKTGNRPDYEKVFFKNIGGSHVDKELDLFNTKLGGYNPVNFGVEGKGLGARLGANYLQNDNVINNSGQFIRENGRLSRNQSIQKLTRDEVRNFGFKPSSISPFSKSHHTAEIRITKEGGERYIYGRALYNSIKKETTFDAGDNKADFKSGLVEYSGRDNSSGNSREGDQYFNRITTPAYAHSYLLTSVLSPDYQDLKNDGPTDDDLGTYTKFVYQKQGNSDTYKWRIPFSENKANYDEGLRSAQKDNKGNYLYGEKELQYIKKIETKTHIAIFELSERNDGYGVKGENGGLSLDSKMYKLDKISLYSKPEYEANKELAVPIKVAHFEYNYSLCQGVDNNKNKGNVAFNGQQGKLTLSKVYFTYKNSEMGKFTPYVFNYASEKTRKTPGYDFANDPINNPKYDMKAYDVWGNYKPTDPNVSGATTGPLSNAEYPFVDQNKVTTDQYTSAWLLKSIHLPSGGEMEVNYESDDYGKVQDKEAMQMFKVVGSGLSKDFTAESISTSIQKGTLGDYIYVALDKKIEGTDAEIPNNFYNKYIKSVGKEDNPMYFRFLLNMVDQKPLPGIDGTDKFDYVTGYLRSSNSANKFGFKVINGKQYVAIPLEKVGKGDGFNAGDPVNPITKAGWNFGRTYLNRLVYSMHNEEDTKSVKGVVMELIGWLPVLFDIFKSPNAQLQEKGIASNFIAGKSWVRLMQPDGNKLGGGSRVKDIAIHDKWDVMTQNEGNTDYQQFYGQKYNYELAPGKSSGVAAYEPLGCKENPFVKPAYEHNKKDLLLGPDTDNYVEEPFGECFFPAPKITYSRVTVSNLPRDKKNAKNEITEIVKKHATGNVVTEFYTSNDFPTITSRTTLSLIPGNTPIALSIFDPNISKELMTLSQGYTIHTNDMDGKMKSQRVYGEGQTEAISGVDYKYNTVDKNENTNQGKLDNFIKTIDTKGNIVSKQVGVDYDVINDFRDSKTSVYTPGVHANTEFMVFGLIPVLVPVPLPSYTQNDTQIRTAVTTKVIHTSGILAETVAYDLGSKVSTKNLAWDAETGTVLLTQTVNEYNDNYYNFNFPAYWSYSGMSQAAKNISLEWDISKTGNNKYQMVGEHKESDYMIDGDELFIVGKNIDGQTSKLKAWVVEVTDSNFQLINNDGLLIKPEDLDFGKIKVTRSGYRNMQSASMASVTLMKNPLNNNAVNIGAIPFASKTALENRIVNASAVEYSDFWPTQCECDMPKMVFKDGEVQLEYKNPNNAKDDPYDIKNRSYNPYLFNIKGNWRANKSYAYLTGRNYTADPTPRSTGFFNDFNPFYEYDNTAKTWGKTKTNFDKWTYASQVTQYNPWGQEVENKDALNRYSAALYGYNNRLPVAVASNTKYKELASDGFEDYDPKICPKGSHFNFQEQLNAQDITVTSSQAHTGKRSLKIAPGKNLEIKKQVVSCSVIPKK
jgi:hypothetical protein